MIYSELLLSSIFIGEWKAASGDHIMDGIGSCVIVVTKINFVASTETVIVVEICVTLMMVLILKFGRPTSNVLISIFICHIKVDVYQFNELPKLVLPISYNYSK